MSSSTADPPSVAIVGGGVAGLSLARALALRGLHVTLLDAAAALGRERPAGAGASSLPIALLNPWRGRKGAAHPDDRRGLAVAWRWAAALEAEGREHGAHRSGVLRVPDGERQARSWHERVRTESERGASAPLLWLPPERVPAPYRAPFGAVLVAGGGWVEPRRWLAALLASARAHGATVRTGSAVARLQRTHDHGWSLHDATGAELARAGRVVLCVGADATPVVVDAGAAACPPDLVRTRGELVALQGGPLLPHPVAGGVYGATAPDRPAATDAGGPPSPEGTAAGTAIAGDAAANGAAHPRRRTWVGGGHRPAGDDDPAAAERLRKAFAWTVPALAEAPVQTVWSGVRAKRADARPWVAERAPGLWWFGAFAGRGFLCAADRAERLAASWAGRDD